MLDLNINQKKRFMLVGLVPQGTDFETILKELEELQLLVKTFGGEVFACCTQKVKSPYRATYIGSGKAQEAADTIAKEKIDIVVLNGIVKIGQLFTLEKIFSRSNENIKVWDKIGLILNIFSLHAHTAEAKLQIKLAQMRHMGPRVYGMGYVLSQQAGGIGTRGIGETNVELMKRHWKNEIKQTKDKLGKLLQERKQQLKRRKREGLETASIIGYTNAGKTTLFNLLTGKNKLVENALFATLDSSVAKLYLPDLKRKILISDTIGFIQKLPPSLIDAFKSTLLESVHASLLIQVIDTSDSDFPKKIEAVEKILRNLEISQKARIFVFNKIDKAKEINQQKISKTYQKFNSQFISAKTGEGVNNLLQVIEKYYQRSEKV